MRRVMRVLFSRGLRGGFKGMRCLGTGCASFGEITVSVCLLA